MELAQELAYIISNHFLECLCPAVGSIGYLMLTIVSYTSIHKNDVEKKSKKSLSDKL